MIVSVYYPEKVHLDNDSIRMCMYSPPSVEYAEFQGTNEVYLMRTYRIRPLLMIVFLLMNAVYLLLVMILIYVYMTQFIVNEASQTRQALLTEMNKQIALSMREAEGTAISISTHPILLNALSYKMDNALHFYETRNDISKMINHYVFSRPIFSSIIIYTDALSKEHYFEQEAPLAPLSEYRWTDLDELDGKDVWIGEHEDNSGFIPNTKVLGYVRKLEDRTGQFAGYLKVNIKASYLFSIGKAEQESVTRLLIDRSNRVVATIDNPLEIDVEHILLGDNTSSSWDELKLGGRSYLVVYSEPNHMDWRMIEVIPYTELFRSLHTIRNVFVTIGGLAALLSLVIAFYLSRKMTQVISDLLQRFRQVEMGSFVVTEKKHPILEIQLLYHGLENMTRRLSMLLKWVKQEQKLKMQAELHARLAQINPHFLYNTLDMINWMVVRKETDDAAVMIGKLSRLLRISLSEGHLFILLGEEIEHGRLYYELQRARFKNQIRFHVEVPSPHRMLYVPKLILQPFIENAVKHGFNPALHDDHRPMEIAIRSSVEAGKLTLMVDNNGNPLREEVAGNSPGEVADSTAKGRKRGTGRGTGYGVRNVRERIQMHFGNEYGVDLLNKADGGVRIQIRLPAIVTEEELKRYQSERH